MSAVTSPHAPSGRHLTLPQGAQLDRPWLVSALIAAVLLLVAFFTPLWEMTLNAPQYPHGLHVTAYGSRMVGDLPEVNELNHYSGVKPIEPEHVLELKLFPFLLFGLIAIVVAGAFLARGRLRLLLRLALWAFPIGFLSDLQWWLYRYGHDLDHDAPLSSTFHAFTPKVIGSTTVVNFHTTAMVSTGFFALLLAALIASFGPAIYRWYAEEPEEAGKLTGVIAGVAVAAGLLLLAPGHAAAAPQESLVDTIAAAAPGSTVHIPPGTYREQITVNKPLTLIGDGWPDIVGSNGGDVVTIAADGVTLRGFVIEAAGRSLTGLAGDPAGLRVEGHGAVIEGNRLRNVLHGIVVQDGGGAIVRDNTVSSIRSLPVDRRGQGIYLYNAGNNLVQHNNFDEVKDGIFVSFSSGNQIEDNTVRHGRYGIHYMYADNNAFIGNQVRDSIAGAVFMYASNVTLRDNDLNNNRSPGSGYGVLLKNVTGVVISGNRIHHNRLGIVMEGVPDPPTGTVRVEHNLIGYNETGLQLAGDASAMFVENSFVDNLHQVADEGDGFSPRNVWSEGGRGNFWSDYQGYDANGNGIGDLPYRYASLYADLMRQQPAVRAYQFSVAESALELGARWFPVYQPQTLVTDPAPLMARTISLSSTGSRSSLPVTLPVTSAMVALPLVVFARLHRNGRQGWQPC